MLKNCKKCIRDFPIVDFYVHSRMADGHLSFCKDCVRERVKEHRQLNIERVKAYNIARGDRRPKDRVKANNAARYVPRKTACEDCGQEGPTQKHHEDYSKPLEVVCLCRACHGIRHRKKNPVPA